MKKILLNLAILFSTTALWAASPTVGNSWLKVPGSAEAAGMGGAFSAVGQDVNALMVNPAGLGLLDGPQLALMHNLWVQDLSTEHLAYGQSFQDHSGGALGLDYINFGSVDKYNVVSGAPVAAGSYSPMAANFSVGYGRELADGFYAGLDLRALTQALDSASSFTAAGDLGFLYQLPNQGPQFALVLANVGGDLAQASLPLLVRLGASYQFLFGVPAPATASPVQKQAPADDQNLTQSLTLGAEGDLTLDSLDTSNFSLGGEYWYHSLLAVRAGYHFAPYGNLNGLAGLTFGAGIRYKNFEFDYALTTLGDLGTTHQLSLLTRL